MARWFPGAPPPRKLAAPRHPSGRIYHRKAKSEEPAVPRYFGYAQRLRAIDPESTDILMLAHVTPAGQMTAKQKADLMIAVKKAEDPRLGYPLGRLWAAGLLCQAPVKETAAEQEEREERAELLEKAGRIYAAQHYLVWTGLGSPSQRVPSHLEKILTEVWGDDWAPPPPAEEELDLEEAEAQRQRMKTSLTGARQVLLKAFPMGLALRVVERLVIDKFWSEVQPGGPVDSSLLKPLRAGLEALRAYYNVRHPPKRGERGQVSTNEAPAEPPAIEKRRPARRGLSIEFGRATMNPPTEDEVARAVQHLKGGKKKCFGYGRSAAS